MVIHIVYYKCTNLNLNRFDKGFERTQIQFRFNKILAHDNMQTIFELCKVCLAKIYLQLWIRYVKLQVKHNWNDISEWLKLSMEREKGDGIKTKREREAVSKWMHGSGGAKREKIMGKVSTTSLNEPKWYNTRQREQIWDGNRKLTGCERKEKSQEGEN